MRVLMCLFACLLLAGCNATVSSYFQPVTDVLSKVPTNPCPSVPVEPSQSYRDCR